MKNGIATGGWRRLKRGQKELSMESLEKKYAKELAAAGPQQKHEIHARMAEELLKQKNHKPSAGALW